MKIKDTNLNYTLNVVSRWVVGLVFLFSSFVKGVDPMGTMFKVQDYMSNWELFGMSFTWAYPLAGTLAVALICAEFLVGVMLVFNAFRIFSAWLLALMMAFFTVTTFIDATTNLVDDCGCFGDAIKLTNWQTFWKNIALDVPTVWIVLTRWMRRKRRFERDSIVFIGALAVMLVFCIYNINHEPVIDFRPWKVGNQMVDMEQGSTPQSYVTYKNTQTGEIMEMESAKLMDYMADTAWANTWEWTSSRVEMPEIKAPGFSMFDMEGSDRALELITAEDGLVIVTIHHLEKIDAEDVEEIKTARTLADENGKEIVLLTSALPEDILIWMYENGIEDMDFYFADATAIETMMRGNPGFMYVKNATVVDKGRVAGELKMEN
jgi:uncharacterized membrane protein YphA (DoxX/SURF4 family)